MIEKPSKPLSFSQINSELGINRNTLNDWIRFDVCTPIKQREYQGRPGKRKGREIYVFPPEQVVRIRRFLFYKKLFSRSNKEEDLLIGDIVVLLDALESENSEELIEVQNKLMPVEEELSDLISMLRAELQFLHSKITGDTEINPEDVEDIGIPED